MSNKMVEVELFCNKARLGARRFSQIWKIQFEEIYSPVMRYTTIRLEMGLVMLVWWHQRLVAVRHALENVPPEEEMILGRLVDIVETS